MTSPSLSPIEAAHAAEVAALREALTKIEQKVSEYLSVGGLFNPELMPPDKVREMVRSIADVSRAALSLTPSAAAETWRPLSEAPREHGKTIRIKIGGEVNAYWDDELKRFVLNRDWHIESIWPDSGYQYRAALDQEPGDEK